MEAEGICKDFQSGRGTLRVLDRITLWLRRGEALAVAGPSGSGKSTLLAVLSGLDSPSEGSVVFDGILMSRMTERDLSRLWGSRIGFVFQSYHLLPSLSAEENVRVPLEIAGMSQASARAREWLKRVGLSDRAAHLPAQLSGGEQQRVALARALVCEPELVFADEPTGNLDSANGAETADLLFGLVRGRGASLVLVTHERPLAERADRLIELKDGRIARETVLAH